MKWVSKFDGGEYNIKPAHGTIEQWKEGRCWSVYCANPIIYVNISEAGNWVFGYCHGDYNFYKYQSLYQNNRRNGTWYLAIKNKAGEPTLTKEEWPECQ